MEEGGCTFKFLTGKPTGKRTLGRPRNRCEKDVKMDHKEIGINMRIWVDSAQVYGLSESLCECEIEPPGFISHGVSKECEFEDSS